MKHLGICDATVLDGLLRAIKGAAFGRDVSVSIEGGMNRQTEDGKPIEVPNGTATIRIYVNGGAVSRDVPTRDSESATRMGYCEPVDS